MQIDVFSSSLGCITVLGSNGLIGSHICRAISQHLRLSRLCVEHHSETICTRKYYDEYFQSAAHASLVSGNSRATSSVQLFIFAFGSGGFSLEEHTALHQIISLKLFLTRFVRSYPDAKVIHVSSLGAIASQLSTPYKHLIQNTESLLCEHESFRVVRLPGIWAVPGTSLDHNIARGLVGLLIQATCSAPPVSIYADMITSRYFLNAKTAANELLRLSLALLKGQLLPQTVNLVPMVKLDINSLISLISKQFDNPISFNLITGKAADRESHSLTAVSGYNCFVNETLDFRILAWPNSL